LMLVSVFRIVFHILPGLRCFFFSAFFLTSSL